MHKRKLQQYNRVKNVRASQSDRVIIKNNGTIIRIVRKGKK